MRACRDETADFTGITGLPGSETDVPGGRFRSFRQRQSGLLPRV